MLTIHWLTFLSCLNSKHRCTLCGQVSIIWSYYTNKISRDGIQIGYRTLSMCLTIFFYQLSGILVTVFSFILDHTITTWGCWCLNKKKLIHLDMTFSQLDSIEVCDFAYGLLLTNSYLELHHFTTPQFLHMRVNVFAPLVPHSRVSSWLCPLSPHLHILDL